MYTKRQTDQKKPQHCWSTIFSQNHPVKTNYNLNENNIMKMKSIQEFHSPLLQCTVRLMCAWVANTSTYFWIIFYSFRYTFSSNHNVHKSLNGLCLWGPDWNPKTKATWTFMNVVIRRKSISKASQLRCVS